MADTTNEIIFSVNTGEAIKSVGELKENIKELKRRIEETQTDTEEGWQTYQETLKELKVNQNALKDAMYATSGTFTDVIKSANGAGQSYNSLVNEMAKLKSEFRATNDEARRNELAHSINEINNKLKEMDALQGNFQRNVGNYQSHWKGMAGSVDALDKGLKSMKGGLGAVKGGFEALSASPAMATIAILVSAVMSITDKLKENEDIMESLKKAMATLKPVMDFFSGILEKIADTLAGLIGKVAEFVTSNGLFDKIVDGLAGVGNAIKELVLTPFRMVVDAVTIFKEKGIKGIREVGQAIKEDIKKGVSFKQNYEAGQAIADTLIAGAKSKKDEAKEVAKQAGEEIGESVAEGIRKGFDKALAEANKKFDEELKRRQEEQAELNAITEQALAETNEEIEAYFEEQERLRQQDLDDAKAKAEAKVALMNAVVSSTTSILGSLADIYESDEKANEKNAKKVKALRIASAIIDTLSGAIGAYMQSVKTYAPPQGAIIGAVQASAVTATGMAQIAKMKATSMTSGSTSGTGNTSAVVSAPSVSTQVNNVRNITSQSEEDRLNRMAGDQKVYILSSDLEADRNSTQVRIQETSF